MAPLTSIAALIYASPRYAAHFWEMIRRTTPELASGEAEFYFVANDATDEVLTYLRDEGVPHVVQRNERLTTAELFDRGVGPPEYIRRVYQGWNRAVHEARSECVVLLNSDHVMRAGWLTTLRREWRSDQALCPLVIEPSGQYGVFDPDVGGGTGAVRGEHGRTLTEFDAPAFEAHAAMLERDAFTQGGVYMPVMFSKRAVLKAGGFPEGNLHGGSFERVSEFGDRHLFQKLADLGIRHRTCHSVVAYHFQEGEMREATTGTTP